jgi:hypothetical protein
MRLYSVATRHVANDIRLSRAPLLPYDEVRTAATRVCSTDYDMAEIISRSILTCPACGQASEENMPVDACVYFYDCKGCGLHLKPKRGDCCVFCSYGSVACPPVQAGGKCCA